MPPTFPIFMGFIAYFVLLGLSGLIGVPMILFKQSRRQGKIIILTAIISYPTLLVVGLTLTILFALPGIGLIFLLDYLGHVYLTGIFLLVFLFIVVISALYHWYLGYVIIRNYFNKRPIDQQIENDKVYSIFIKRIVKHYDLIRKFDNKKAAANKV